MSAKVTGIVAYLGIIGWLIAWLAGDKEGAKFHLNQALVLFIAGLIISLVPCVGSIVYLVFVIMGIVSAAKEEEKALPVIGKFQILK